MNGLGSNTCIQDSFNLAWKVAYVMKGRVKLFSTFSNGRSFARSMLICLAGHAGPGLLESYSAERQPVGQAVVQR
jgi:2,4-dichlorophenol 6-monooxygenase